MEIVSNDGLSGELITLLTSGTVAKSSAVKTLWKKLFNKFALSSDWITSPDSDLRVGIELCLPFVLLFQKRYDHKKTKYINENHNNINTLVKPNMIFIPFTCEG